MTKERQAQLRSALLHALEKRAGKEGDRELLTAGSYEVEARVEATVEGEQLLEVVKGKLLVNPDTEGTSSSGADANEVIAAILARLPEQNREAILRDLPTTYLEAGNEFKGLSVADVKRVKKMLERMRCSTTTSKKGTVSFAPAA